MVTRDQAVEHINKKESLFYINDDFLIISVEPVAVLDYNLNEDNVVVVDTYSGPYYGDSLYVSHDECHLNLCKTMASELGGHIYGFESESDSLAIAKYLAEYFSSIYEGMKADMG